MSEAQATPLSLADRLEIQELISRYNWAIDTHDGPGVADTFTPDGVFEGVGRSFEGREALVGFGAGTHLTEASLSKGSQHWVTNLVLEGDSNAVIARSMFTRQNVDGDRYYTGPIGHYRDEIVKVAGRWPFKKRLYRNWPSGGERAHLRE